MKSVMVSEQLIPVARGCNAGSVLADERGTERKTVFHIVSEIDGGILFEPFSSGLYDNQLMAELDTQTVIPDPKIAVMICPIITLKISVRIG